MRADPTPERARRIHEDEVARCVAMGAHAAELVPPAARILTHCNAGGLATGGYGSAVGAIRAAAERGGVSHVWVDETRPLLQGARLTAFELEAVGIPHAVIVDSAAASRMAAGEVDIVITGADRIAANGDTANKIGTYSLAVLARHHEIPFVIVAPTSTIDPATPTGAEIPIEERDGSRGDAALPGAQSRLRRHSGRPDHGDRDRGGHPSGAVRGVAARAGGLAVILDEIDPASRATLEAARLRRRAVRGAPPPARRRHADGGRQRRPGRGRAAAAVGSRCRCRSRATGASPRPEAAGVEALQAGTVAMVVLAGGMATRFGGGVKAVAEAIDGRSFLEVKLDETARLGAALGAEIPVALMTSFATDEAVRAHVAEKGLGDPLWFCQTAAPRLRPDGSVFVEDDGKASLYGPGHGDVLSTIRVVGHARRAAAPRRPHDRRLERRQPRRAPRSGRRRACTSLAGTPLTVEVVAKGDDTGGAPARVDGQPQLLEAMRFPPDVRPGAHPGLQHEHLADRGRRARRAGRADLARRREDGRRCSRWCSSSGSTTSSRPHVPTTFLVVPRHGPRGRFLPVKEPADLVEVQPRLRELLATPLPSAEG